MGQGWFRASVRIAWPAENNGIISQFSLGAYCRLRAQRLACLLHEWTAAVAALVFLFFAVSLSDDLHSDLVLFEEGASGRRQAVVLASAHSAHPGVKEASASSLAVLPRVAWGHQLYSVGYLAPFQQSSLSLSRTKLSFGRAPPFASL